MPLSGMVATPRDSGAGAVGRASMWAVMRESSAPEGWWGEVKRADEEVGERVERWFRREVRAARVRSCGGGRVSFFFSFPSCCAFCYIRFSSSMWLREGERKNRAYVAGADVLLAFDVEVDDFEEQVAFLHDDLRDLSQGCFVEDYSHVSAC